MRSSLVDKSTHENHANDRTFFRAKAQRRAEAHALEV